ncbi:MAG: response regulator [Candidatus Omnitrophota bacterium]
MPELRWELVRVLVVDDDPVANRLAAACLKKLGCQVMLCTNGRDAVDALRIYNFDICFMDIMMPIMNGIEAAQIIRDDITRVLPIIAVTSSNMKATKEKCVDVGMNDFITKPLTVEILNDVVARYALRHP